MKFTKLELSKLKKQEIIKTAQMSGYHWDQGRQQWRVSFRINGPHWFGGMYDDEQDAIARVKAKRKEMAVL